MSWVNIRNFLNPFPKATAANQIKDKVFNLICYFY